VLLLELPGGLVSCHWHSWGSPCRVFPSEFEQHSRRVWFKYGWCIFLLSVNRRRSICQDSPALPARKQMRPNKYTARCGYATPKSVHCLLWFYPPQVAVTLMGFGGLSGYITNQHRLQEPLLSCTSPLDASSPRLYFRALSVNQPELSPKKALNPHRLCTLLHIFMYKQQAE